MEKILKSENIAVVLNKPRYSENIGSVARAMLNMGFRELLVVNPEQFDREKAAKLATHSAQGILDTITFQKDLAAALSTFHYVVGTTARCGGQRAVTQLGEAAGTIASLSSQNRVALVFGPEDRGLSNEDIRMCHTLITIPTIGFSSLNLAQAVMVVCYELFTASHDNKEFPVSRLAERHELDILYDKIEHLLEAIDYRNPENPDYWINHIRNFLNRRMLQAGEVSIIRGVIRKIFDYGEKRYQEGGQNVVIEHKPE